MMNRITTSIDWLNGNILWGPPMLILLVGTGLYLTILLRGLQLTRLGLALRLIFRKDDAEGDISHFAALTTALAATVGNGNIVGVASAIILGGPGAVFWMWIIGLVGMATKYAEAILAVKYREQGPFGMRGGPMYYISKGAGLPKLGWLFALFCVFAGFGMGNMFQAHSVAENFHMTFNIPQLATGIAMALLTGMVLLGGIQAIGRITSFVVPFMILLYVVAALVVLAINWQAIPAAFGMIFTYAFTPHALLGGGFGALLMITMRQGMARGVFSNESGLGSAPIAAAAARTNEPATQALVSMTQTFIDTIVVCTMTALVILTSTSFGQAENFTLLDKATLTAASFGESIGRSGGIIVAIASALFAYSTILGWAYYGERSIEYIIGSRAVMPYRALYTIVVLVATLPQVTIDFIILLSDMMNALMAIPNLIGLLLLAHVVRRETERYFRNGEHRKPAAPAPTRAAR